MPEKPDLKFRALVARKNNSGGTTLSIDERRTTDLPDHNVLIRVHYSSLNYKDALSATGNPGVTKLYPHTPGIDAAGVVEWSTDSRISVGDEILVTGYDLGQNTSGGFGEYVCVPADWCVQLPEELTLRESMILGTAGFTAAYGVKKIVDQDIALDNGPLLVTGATGGVGSLAVAILAKIGFKVIAVTGKADQEPFLRKIGAAKVSGRDWVTDVPHSPMLSPRWSAAIDTVGGEMLDAVIRQTDHNGVVACCGNILGGKLETSIYPLILRGISVMGIDSGNCLMKDRVEIWNKLANKWKPSYLESMSHKCGLSDLPREIETILKGNQVGRTLIDLRD